MHESPNLGGTRTFNQKEVLGHPVKPPKIAILQHFVFQMVFFQSPKSKLHQRAC